MVTFALVDEDWAVRKVFLGFRVGYMGTSLIENSASLGLW